MQIAKNKKKHWEIRSAALEKISKKKYLLDIIKKENNKKIVEFTNEKIKVLNGSSVQLEKLSNHSKFWRIRRSAVKNIIDQKALSYIAQNDEDWEVRCAAVSNKSFKDQKILGKIIDNDENLFVCLATINNITDQKLILKIEKQNSSPWIRGAILDKIISQKLLEDIALNDKDSHVRLKAIELISNPKILIDVALNDDDNSVRRYAIENKNFIDQNVLKEIVLNDKDYFVIEDALKKIFNQKLLMEIVKKTSINKFLKVVRGGEAIRLVSAKMLYQGLQIKLF